MFESLSFSSIQCRDGGLPGRNGDGDGDGLQILFIHMILSYPEEMTQCAEPYRRPSEHFKFRSLPQTPSEV